MRSVNRSTLFFIVFYLFTLCEVSWAGYYCAVAHGDLLHSSGTWYLDKTTVEHKGGDYCMISFDANCDIKLGYEVTTGPSKPTKPWGCELVGKTVRCLCAGRMCNLHITKFHRMAKTKLDDLKKCSYSNAPELETPLKDVVHCVNRLAIKTINTQWSATVDEKKVRHVCGIYIKRDCQVDIYASHVGFGLQYLNKCAIYDKDEIWCECTDDYCNGDIAKWINMAKNVSSNMDFTACDLQNPPTVLRPSVQTTTPTLAPKPTPAENMTGAEYCGISEIPYFNNGTYTPQYTTYVATNFPCSISFTGSCTVTLGHATSNKSEGCEKRVNMGRTEFECFCKQRMCNYDLEFFLEQIKELGDDQYKNCELNKAPSMRAMSSTQKCYTGNRLDSYRYRPGVFKKSGQDWRKPVDTITETTGKGCTIVFKKDCEVILSPASKNYGAVTFDTCVPDPYHLSGSIVCQCFDWDNCNVDIKKWLKLAENAGIKDWKCDWDKDNIPEYYVFPPTTPRPTTRVTRLFIEYTPATAGEMGNPPVFSEEETVPTTTQVTAVCSIYVGVLFSSSFYF